MRAASPSPLEPRLGRTFHSSATGRRRETPILLTPPTACQALATPPYVTSWPNSHAVVETNFAGIPDDERDLIVAGNAARLYGI